MPTATYELSPTVVDSDSDTSSLLTLTDSLREELYKIKGGKRHIALNDDYKWAIDAGHTKFELLLSAIMQKTYGKVCFEPEDGLVNQLLDSSSGPARILDIGSGVSASWASLMAERYPESEVIGVDLVSSDLNFLPPNLDIEVHDVLEGLPYPDDYFALIHARMVFGTVFLPSNSILPEIIRCLRPGGALVVEEVECLGAPTFGFYSHSPTPHLDPHLSVARARNGLHIQSLTAKNPGMDLAPMHEWLIHAREIIASYEGLEGVVERGMEYDIGARGEAEAGPKDSQRGTLIRELALQIWELDRTQSGEAVDDERAEELRKWDAAVLSEWDVGLYVKASVVWARKV